MFIKSQPEFCFELNKFGFMQKRLKSEIKMCHVPQFHTNSPLNMSHLLNVPNNTYR